MTNVQLLRWVFISAMLLALVVLAAVAALAFFVLLDVYRARREAAEHERVSEATRRRLVG